MLAWRARRLGDKVRHQGDSVHLCVQYRGVTGVRMADRKENDHGVHLNKTVEQVRRTKQLEGLR